MAGLMGMAQSAGGFDSTQSAGGCTGAQSAAKWGYPMSEVTGRSREDPTPERQHPRGVSPRPRSGAVAECARL